MLLVIVHSHLALFGYVRVLIEFKWNETSVLMVHSLEDTSFLWIGFSCRCERNTRKSVFIKTVLWERRSLSATTADAEMCSSLALYQPRQKV